MEMLTEIFIRLDITSFSLIPVLREELNIISHRISAEKIQTLYCQECQDTINMEDGFLEIVNDKVFGFCCEDCKNSFIDKQNKIIKQS